VSLLEIRGLERRYGGIRAVAGLDLDVEQGELRCLIGPNGAGKSTVFKLIMGLDRPDRGAIRFAGEEVTRLQPFARARRGLSMKYQTTRVYLALTVAQNITIACGRSAQDGGLVPFALDYFDLAATMGRPAHALTYGQQHWLEMALALGTRPRLLLMDEPTAGMTPEETRRTAAFLKDLKGRGLTVIVVEHDMAFVREVAERVSVLHQGALFREGSLGAIETDPEVRRVYLGERHG
jgi:branched-chain amino acid transport system ATP-binding protein